MIFDDWRTKLAILQHNRRTGKGHRPLWVRREGNLFRLSSGGRAIYLVSLPRWRWYRWGIDTRLRDLAAQYGILGLETQFAGKTILDIGSNIGEFALFAHENGAKVIAFEPDPRHIEALNKNFAGLPIEIVAKALWNEKTTLTFYSATATADSSLIEPKAVERKLDVEAVTLDEFAAERGIGEIFLIKADAEGAEPEVLSGARETLKRARYIAIDCGPERKGADTVAESRAILESVGFNVDLLPGGRMVLFCRNTAFDAAAVSPVLSLADAAQ